MSTGHPKNGLMHLRETPGKNENARFQSAPETTPPVDIVHVSTPHPLTPRSGGIVSRTGLHKLRITADSPFPTDVAIELDDRPLYASRLTLEPDCQAVTEVTPTFDADQIEVTAEALVALEAHVLPKETP